MSDKKMFVDVHVIQSVPPSCINRDDTGSPKSAVYGGVRRARVSSQSWKRAMRLFFRERFDESELDVRTTRIIELVAEKIQEKDKSVSTEDAVEMAKKIIETAGIKIKESKKKKGEENAAPPVSAALFFMSMKQASNLADLALTGDYSKNDVKEALNKGNGVEIALFGRMVADDPSLNADASSQVAHSISTHAVDNEYDYYTAVDDRSKDDESGAGMIGTVEFNSSTLYRYATVAIHDLKKQLSDSEATAKAMEEFVRAFILSMPTGKQNTFANRVPPFHVTVCIREDQPVNLVGAFESPVHTSSTGGYNENSVKKLLNYESEVCSDFVKAPSSEYHVGWCPESVDSVSLDDLIKMIGDAVREL